jgi:2-polyprenyl-3-methyl-5-hydroxy-6-metoxy-1,4-benzoquinol methylase
MNCPICQGYGDHNAAIPFNKSCESFEHTGDLIEYLTCRECSFTWAPELCAKDPAWFAEHIYNADYHLFDPEYGGERAARQAKNIIHNYHWVRKQIRHLDFGSGEGQLTERLVKAGFDSTAYDPFVQLEAPVGKFNLITCFEVFEHVPDPRRLMRHLASYLDDTGILIASTLLTNEQGLLADWWYAAPRNGHISLYSGQSLGKLAVQHGLCARISSEGTHSFFRNLPDWAKST